MISVIIPVYNAAETLSQSLDSLRSQSCLAWEAVVVDDGSIDDSLAVARRAAESDRRIRVFSTTHLGVSGARNFGVQRAVYDWLLFFDADDWMSVCHLERLAERISSCDALDGVYCPWVGIAPDGTRFEGGCPDRPEELFATSARTCPFAIHSCIVRRSVFEAVGGFDTSLHTCEDWDLWQRIFRSGAAFAPVDDIVAPYRLRSDCAETDGFRLFSSGLSVIKRGHSNDPRLSSADPRFVSGAPADELTDHCLGWAIECAGLMIGRGEDGTALVPLMAEHFTPTLDPFNIATHIFDSALRPSYQKSGQWVSRWGSLVGRIDEFLHALEVQSQIAGLAVRVRTALERMVIQAAPSSVLPVTIGTSHAARIEITEPLSDIRLAADTRRLHCMVEMEQVGLGTLELPVVDGMIPSVVLADAIAAKFSWRILEEFLLQSVYGSLRYERDQNGLHVWRDALQMASIPSGDEADDYNMVHEHVGWTVFLQEIWNRPNWPQERFYDAAREEHATPANCRVDSEWLTIEASSEIPTVTSDRSDLFVELTVGGVPVGYTKLCTCDGRVTAQELRAAVTVMAGYELCCIAVREGIIGKRRDNGRGLRCRLAEAAKQYYRLGMETGAETEQSLPAVARSSWTPLLRTMRQNNEPQLAIARRSRALLGTAPYRRATLPSAAASELLESATVEGTPVVRLAPPGLSPARILYLPELLWQGDTTALTAADFRNGMHPADTRECTRQHFETLFAERTDPWDYCNSYEQTKYKQTLALLPKRRRIHRALELACAEGHFTVQLAQRVDRLVAADISQIAIQRAKERCAHLEHVTFLHLDLTEDDLPGDFDVVVCSEVLYFVKGVDELDAIGHKLAASLRPGGYLLTAHARLISDESVGVGFDWNLPFGAETICRTLSRNPSLRVARELRTPLYRIAAFQKLGRRRPALRRLRPKIEEIDDVGPLPPDIARMVQSAKNCPQPNVPAKTPPTITDRFPILMYHRIGGPCSLSTARHCVSRERFEEQLCYLRDSGYYSATLEDWHYSVTARRPLPGRAILLTFDDGYLDFYTTAWPLLKQYGFSATVFVVTDYVGKVNEWDRGQCEIVPLLGWEQIVQLREEGVAFGSHSSTHAPLGSLSNAEVAREAARSRIELARKLGDPPASFAYPYGDADEATQHIIGGCGYSFGLTCVPRPSRFGDNFIALPRIEIEGADGLAEFVKKLNINMWSHSQSHSRTRCNC